MGRLVIVGYQPHQGHEHALIQLLSRHIQVLDQLGFVTPQKPLFMRNRSGIFLEIFEWRDAKAIQDAHHHPQIQALWSEFAKVCAYVPLDQLPESHDLFAEFDRFELPKDSPD